VYGGVVVLPDPIQEMRTRKNFADTQQSGHTLQDLDLELKMEEAIPKMARRRGSDADNPEGGAPTSRRLIVVVQSPLLHRVVD